MECAKGHAESFMCLFRGQYIPKWVSVVLLMFHSYSYSSQCLLPAGQKTHGSRSMALGRRRRQASSSEFGSENALTYALPGLTTISISLPERRRYSTRRLVRGRHGSDRGTQLASVWYGGCRRLSVLIQGFGQVLRLALYHLVPPPQPEYSLTCSTMKPLIIVPKRTRSRILWALLQALA
jgi:hypothetical protein